MSENLKLGQIITTPQHRDAIHIAVVPIRANERLRPGQRVGLTQGGDAAAFGTTVGVVDPYLMEDVSAGQMFWLFLNPGSITSLRHDWTHPAFQDAQAALATDGKTSSEQWMRKWAMDHVSYDYYGDNESVGEEAAYAFAINIGYRHSVGPYESARDHIDNEWWGHWEAITGVKGDRESYFSCAC